ncbi:serine/threonine-protein kinase sck1-like [Dendronephthya gigantea]|uniref:serine/threonine-protein kinase sck1-like n=1 Tax=Dendronephthya gigantea TaxID=151771 RepID=UPI00106AC5C1|nr:serine/threonine-protein kinase sck1-like [Dendronephthya gigantea]
MIFENFNVDYDNSHNTKDSSNYNFAGSVLKDQLHQFGKDVQDKLDLLKNELQQKFEAEFEALFARVKKVNELDSQCPGIQKLVKEEDFQSEKKAVENCLKDETFQDLKKQEDLFERKNDARKYPKISQCAGGNGNNSASKTEVKVAKENKPCNQATASPTGNGCGKNGEGFGDDGNDPPEKKFSCLKPHYLDIVVPKKSRQNDKFQESSYKESHPEESHLEAMPYQETPDLSSNENRSGPSDSNQSKDVEMDILEPLDMNVVTLSDSKDDKCDDSNNQGLDILTGSKSNMCEASQEQSGNIQETTTDGGFDKMEVDASCLPGLHILPGSKNNRHEPLHGQSGNEPATAVGSKMQVDPSYHLEMNAGETSHFQIGNKPDETIKNGPSALDSYRPLPYTILLQFDPVLNIHGKDGLYKHHRDFTILRVIDRGKFGVCYEIEDLASRKKFALKKIKSRDFDLIELEIWSKIRPTHVITPLGAYDDGNDVYIFMELMDGTFKFIGHNREALGLTEERIAALIKPILECLDLIHREKWVHADIKPENTFFGHNCVKLGDFGLAVNLLTQNKKYGLRGTAPYMSPEICREEGYGPL